GISREVQDSIAAHSHQRAAEAHDNGVLAAEITPVTVASRRSETIVEADEGIRAETTEEGLARLRPAFAADGTITAGNASQLSDGAAAVVLTSRAVADQEGWPVLATLGAVGQVAGPDNSLHSQPARAITTALERGGWRLRDLDF